MARIIGCAGLCKGLRGRREIKAIARGLMVVKSRESRMKHWRTSVVAILALAIIVATGHAALAARAQCNAELRKCTSHCNLVYESKRANRVCRDHCKDSFYGCKARLG